MNGKNRIILILVIAGILVFGLVEGYIKPRMADQRQQYAIEQQDPLTHDFGNVQKYKNPYMGNASNLINLFNALPLKTIQKKFQLHPQELKADINYEEAASEVEGENLKSSLVYNATAAFVLIDNLQSISFNFTDASYLARRRSVEVWYGMTLSELSDKDLWKREVQDKLNDMDYVETAIKAFFEEEEK